MTDLSRTQSEWTRLTAREIAHLVFAPVREFREGVKKFTRERTRVIDLGALRGTATAVAALTLAGLDVGVNCTSEYRLYLRFVVNGSNWDLHFYKATGAGGGDEVASVTDIAASGTAALVAVNDSGISGSITLGATVVADATDRYQILGFPDYNTRLPKVLTQADGVEDDTHTRDAIQDFYASCADRYRGMISDARRCLERILLTDGRRNPVARGNEFTRTKENALVSDVEVDDGSANISRLRTGWHYVLKAAMEDETDAGEQDIVRRVVSAAAGVFSGNNDGLGAVASHTPQQKCPSGLWTWKCVDDTLGSERFDGFFKADDGTEEAFDFFGLQVEKQWAGPRGFGPITLTRTKSKTNDGSNLRFAAASGAVVTGANSLNTDDGDLHFKLVANGSNWDIEIYSASSLHTSKLVAKATNIAASAAFTATEQRSSGLEVSWTLGGTVTAVTNIVLSLNPFKLENANGVPDEFTITTSVAASPGEIATILAEEFDAEWNTDTSGSESIPDNYAKAGTYVPFTS